MVGSVGAYTCNGIWLVWAAEVACAALVMLWDGVARVSVSQWRMGGTIFDEDIVKKYFLRIVWVLIGVTHMSIGSTILCGYCNKTL